MKPIATAGFHHITMVSGDAARTVRFYRDLLGLGLVKKTVNFDDPTAYHLYFGDATGAPGTLLTFFEWAGLPRGRWGVGGVHHLALGVESETAQLKWKRRLMDAGISVTGPYDRGYFHSIYFSDPDGQILEIATAGPGYAIDEPANALGTELKMPADSLLRGSRDEEAIAQRTHSEPVTDISADMELTGIHHISAITDELERAGEFYEAALGLSLVKKTVNRDDAKIPHYFWASYDGDTVAPRSSLTLFGWEGSTPRTRGGTGQTHHIAFRAADDELQLAWREHLLEIGVQVTPVLDRNYFKSLYFRAPDGLLCEIATDGPGFAVDEAPGELGRTLKLPAWLEQERATIEGRLSELPAAPVGAGRTAGDVGLDAGPA